MHFDFLDHASSTWLRGVGLSLASLWAAWWVFFGVASGIAEGLDNAAILLHATVPGLLFAASVLIAWRTEALGATLLAGEGLIVLFIYPALAFRFPASTIVLVLLTMAVPPLVAGTLLMLATRPAVRPIHH